MTLPIYVKAYFKQQTFAFFVHGNSLRNKTAQKRHSYSFLSSTVRNNCSLVRWSRMEFQTLKSRSSYEKSALRDAANELACFFPAGSSCRCFVTFAFPLSFARFVAAQMAMIREGLLLSPATRKNLALLQLIAGLSLVMVALRRRLMRIPDVNALLMPLPGQMEFCSVFLAAKKGKQAMMQHQFFTKHAISHFSLW